MCNVINGIESLVEQEMIEDDHIDTETKPVIIEDGDVEMILPDSETNDVHVHLEVTDGVGVNQKDRDQPSCRPYIRKN